MTTVKDSPSLTSTTLVVAGVGGALLANWIHAGWISAVIGAAAAIAIVAYGLAGRKA